MNPSQREMAIDQWLALRKEAAAKIDPENAEVWWDYGCGSALKLPDGIGTDVSLGGG